MTFPFAEVVGGMALRVLCVGALLWTWNASSDQVEMSNGDRYVGRVLSLSGETLVLQSEVLGNLRLPRARISNIQLEPRPASGSSTNITRMSLVAPHSKLSSSSNSVGKVSATPTNTSSQFSAAMQQLGTNTNMVRQVQDQLLTGAGPEAQAKFNDLMGGLRTGKMDLAGLRAEAKSTLEQARRMRGDLGEEGGGMLDSYLAILDGFLKETDSEAAATNKTAAIPPKAPAQKLQEQE